MRKTKLGLTPMDFYDGEVIARALEAKARQGLHLREIGSFFLYYDRGEPKKARYRVEYAGDKTGEPDGEFLEYCRAAGWEYVGCIRKMLYVLRAARPDAEELHTDPVVRAMSMKRAAGTLRSAAILNVVAVLAILSFLLYLFGSAGALRTPLAILVSGDRSLMIPLFLLVELLAAVQSVRSAVRLRRFQKALARGETPPPDAKGARRLRVCRVAGIVSLALALWICVSPFFRLFSRTEDIAGRTDLVYVPLEILQNDPDYAPMSPMYSGGHDIFACVEYGGSLLTAEQYEIYEGGQATRFGDPAGELYPPRASTSYYRLHIAAWADDLGRQLVDAAQADYEKDCADSGGTPLTATRSQPACPGLDGALLARIDGLQWLAAWKDGQVVFLRHFGPDNTSAALAYLARLLA